MTKKQQAARERYQRSLMAVWATYRAAEAIKKSTGKFPADAKSDCEWAIKDCSNAGHALDAAYCKLDYKAQEAVHAQVALDARHADAALQGMAYDAKRNRLVPLKVAA